MVKTDFEKKESFTNDIRRYKNVAIRAERISGQLGGTIPSTSEGQNANNSSLIDASHLNLSDMGSMNGGAPGGGSQMPGNNAQPTPGNIDQQWPKQQGGRAQRQNNSAQSEQNGRCQAEATAARNSQSQIAVLSFDAAATLAATNGQQFPGNESFDPTQQTIPNGNAGADT